MKNKYVRNPERNAINRQTFFEKLYPDIPKEGVYCIYNEIKELIYVGESNNLPRRMAEHIGGYDKTKSFHKGKLENSFVKDYYTYKIIETKTLKERLIKEIELEFEYEPEYNKRWQRS